MSNAIPKLMNRVIKKYKFPIYENHGILLFDCGLQLKTIKNEVGKITVTAIVDVFPIPKLAKQIERETDEAPANNNKVCYRYAVRKHKELIEANSYIDFENVRSRMQYFGVVA